MNQKILRYTLSIFVIVLLCALSGCATLKPEPTGRIKTIVFASADGIMQLDFIYSSNRLTKITTTSRPFSLNESINSLTLSATKSDSDIEIKNDEISYSDQLVHSFVMLPPHNEPDQKNHTRGFYNIVKSGSRILYDSEIRGSPFWMAYDAHDVSDIDVIYAYFFKDSTNKFGASWELGLGPDLRTITFRNRMQRPPGEDGHEIERLLTSSGVSQNLKFMVSGSAFLSVYCQYEVAQGNVNIIFDQKKVSM